MARRGDQARRLKSPAARPPVVREFSAGGLVCRRVRGEWTVCLAGRRIHPGSDLVWILPKGHVEEGEHMEETALREVREETGLEAEIVDRLGDVTYWYVRHEREGGTARIFKRVRFFLMLFRGGRFADRDEEMDDVRWFSLDRAETMLAYANERALMARACELLAGREP
jgi:8-oxo-dGTP pyrophosphatase MutT (NUDIX family)